MGVHQWQSNEDHTSSISKSVYVTNFPETCSARDLWKVCSDYGTVVDVFIPFKKSKAGKRFAFVRYDKVNDLDHLVENLCTIWIGRFHIHANVARFHRPLKPITPTPREPDLATSKNSFAPVLKDGSQSPVKELVNSKHALVLDDTCIKEHDFSLSLMGLPIKAWTPNSFRKIALLWGEIVEWQDSDSFGLSNKHLCLQTKIDDSINERRKIIIQGENFVGNKDKIDSSDIDRVSESSFSHANELVHDNSNNNVTGLGNKTKKGWIKELCHKHRINFVAIQETKMESIDLFSIKSLWGNLNFDHVVGSSVGFSGGILCVWDARMFTKEHVSKSDYFVVIMGTWASTSTKLLVISVYVPQEITEKQDLWNYLRSLIEKWDGEIVIMGDFNEVCYEHERFGATFNSQGANAFNNFISLAGLIDLPLEGYTYTWAHKSASKMSKLDRHLSDHRPILLKENSFDFGPTPFRIFHSWFSMKDFDSFVETTWKSMNVLDSNGLVRMKKKLQLLKNAIKELNSLEATDISQKAKIRWTIEGDENTKYFHGTLNKKRYQLAIRGTLVNGEWTSDHDSFDYAFPNRLSSDQVKDLEHVVTYDEVKKAVWDCGANKSLSVLVKNGANGLMVALKLPWDRFSSMVALSEFQFHKGLKQGDPISPFLFILIMETIHLSLIELLTLISSKDEVEMTVNLVGCSTFTSPFKYLGVKVGDNMSRLNSWDYVISKVSNRLSNWKLKTLSIGGRLTLIKSVLSLIPLYHMSIFKAPMGVLNKLEYIRRNFFNETDEACGSFSVRSTRIYIDENILSKVDALTRWVKVIPIKVNIHAWRVCLDKIPTRLNLSLRGLDIPSILCPLCNLAAKSTSHIFFSCSLARQVWSKVMRWWVIDVTSFV
uniref:RNA-directed DNA polymerase, eukaryota n=1 Tax=Tanacetum cinerariifolium TaxID=118510 RepID=A0A6L2JBA6_TANCI|nr:RNA-directed DNA polymerase, eukaryota [Tanacetum cinerariifolium]